MKAPQNYVLCLTRNVNFTFHISVATSITPRPNALMLMASGTNFGLKRNLPHILGVGLGHGFIVFVFGLGLTDIFETFPEMRFILTLLCSAYLLWLSWKIANAALHISTGCNLLVDQSKGALHSHLSSDLLAPEAGGWMGALFVTICFLMMNFPRISVWVWFGQKVRRYLKTGKRLQIFNITMGGLLAATLIPIVSDLFS